MAAAVEKVATVANVLGLPAAKELLARTPLGLISVIKDGLPVKTLDKVAQRVAPGDVQFKYRIVPKATLERRKAAHRLSVEEGTRLARLARVWSVAADVWKDADATRNFLFRPHPMAEDNRPIDLVIESEFGADLVVEILGGLKYGTAA